MTVCKNVSLNFEILAELRQIQHYKKHTLLIVMMEYRTYEDWSDALDQVEKVVETVMNFVKLHHIDGVQFSNLHPTVLNINCLQFIFHLNLMFDCGDNYGNSKGTYLSIYSNL